jgi:hypothetical protein
VVLHATGLVGDDGAWFPRVRPEGLLALVAHPLSLFQSHEDLSKGAVEARFARVRGAELADLITVVEHRLGHVPDHTAAFFEGSLGPLALGLPSKVHLALNVFGRVDLDRAEEVASRGVEAADHGGVLGVPDVHLRRLDTFHTHRHDDRLNVQVDAHGRDVHLRAQSFAHPETARPGADSPCS